METKIKPKRITDFKNDLVFKYLLSNMKDEQCRRLLKLIIEDVMDIKCKKINVLNSELNPHHISDKDMILDIQVITEDGELVDIEMQNSIFSKELYHRLQAYEARMIDHQVNRGDERYSDHLHKVNLITFINDIDKDNLVLIDSYVPRNEYGNVRKFNLATSYFVQLPFIKVIEKEKRLENFSRLEILIYILYHGLTHDIISLDNEVVTIMKDKMEQFNEDEELVLAAEKRQLVKIQHYHEGQRMHEEGKAEGKLASKKEDTLMLFKSKFPQEGKEEGELLKAKEKTLKLFNKRFPDENNELLENLALLQYDQIFDALLENEDLKTIKKIIGK